MIIKPLVLEELKEIFSRALLSRTDKITKITDGSVVNGNSFGVARLGQKAMKDIALATSHWFPDSTYGEYLDNIANLHGISLRFASLPSTTYLRIHGSPGTTYIAGVNVFSGLDGISFDLEANVVIPSFGFTYAKVVSQENGLKTNVEPLTINKVNPVPLGHTYVINDFACQYGRDIEDDDSFRIRIKNANNIASRSNIAMLEQVFMNINPNVLRIFNHGSNGLGKVRLAVLTQNSAALSNENIEELLSNCGEYFSLDELHPDGLDFVGVELVNVTFQPFDCSYRVKLDPNFNPDEVRKEMQVRVQNYLDYRYWKIGNKVEWDDLLQLIKQTEGVLYVSDQFSNPQIDISVDPDKLPRLRGFELRDLDGNIISSTIGTLNPTFFPNSLDFNYIRTILASL